MVLEDDVVVSQYSYLCTVTHKVNQLNTADNSLITAPIWIKEKAWIGTKAFISLSICIGKTAIVGATASVYKSVEDYNIVSENPAQFIKKKNFKGIMSIAAIILTKNEEKHIMHCVNSLKEIYDEIWRSNYSSDNTTREIAETLASGTPVITTRTPWKKLNTLHCRWYTKVGTEATKQALCLFLQTSEKELEAMRKRGKKLIEEKYSTPIVAYQMNNLYKKL